MSIEERKKEIEIELFEFNKIDRKIRKRVHCKKYGSCMYLDYLHLKDMLAVEREKNRQLTAELNKH